ncbi:ferrochelatase [Isoalcanivorax beigongshangi]|uniref:Ferrochelatase n=1 Tax=Isoalcanivorax beigongshangi TaxID=3238810 RepID=A0ABV4AGZ4_9GAMM
MRYQSPHANAVFDQPRTAVLLVNLGTPDAPTPAALRRYLKEFLWDPRVVEIPRLPWWLILNLLVLRLRPKRSAAAYRTVWTERGSPLLFHTQDQCDRLREALQAQYPQLEVAFAMRYGSPSLPQELDRLQAAGVDKLIVLPLYPQYSGSTTGSVVDALGAHFRRRRWVPSLHVVGEYHRHPAYIEALAEQVEQYWARHGRGDRLVFSFHGVPERYATAGDPYPVQCHATAALLAARLGLAEDAWQTTFQSRFGKAKWLTPYTDQTMKALPGQGVKHVQLFCPGFSADCLETLEEIAVENRGYFIEAGGERFEYISALNAEPRHINMMAAVLAAPLADWADRSHS